MATDLKRGAYSGKETYLYYNSATHDLPNWELVVRARNVTVNDGPELNDVNFHGANNTTQIPGYAGFNGSFEYVRKVGTDAVYTALRDAAAAGSIIELAFLDGPLATDGSAGWRAPCVFGEFAETANGGDPVSFSVPFSLADAYDSSDNVVEREFVTATGGALG